MTKAKADAENVLFSSELPPARLQQHRFYLHAATASNKVGGKDGKACVAFSWVREGPPHPKHGRGMAQARLGGIRVGHCILVSLWHRAGSVVAKKILPLACSWVCGTALDWSGFGLILHASIVGNLRCGMGGCFQEAKCPVAVWLHSCAFQNQHSVQVLPDAWSFASRMLWYQMVGCVSGRMLRNGCGHGWAFANGCGQDYLACLRMLWHDPDRMHSNGYGHGRACAHRCCQACLACLGELIPDAGSFAPRMHWSRMQTSGSGLSFASGRPRNSTASSSLIMNSIFLRGPNNRSRERKRSPAIFFMTKMGLSISSTWKPTCFVFHKAFETTHALWNGMAIWPTAASARRGDIRSPESHHKTDQGHLPKLPHTHASAAFSALLWVPGYSSLPVAAVGHTVLCFQFSSDHIHIPWLGIPAMSSSWKGFEIVNLMLSHTSFKTNTCW